MTDFIQTRWGRIAFEDTGGSKSPVVLLHGGASNLRAWDGVISVLETSNRCISIDLPGHGQTRIQPLMFPQLRDALVEICERLGIAQPLLVGHSFGGLASVFAANTRGLAAAVMAIDPYLSDREVARTFATLDEALDDLRQMEWPWPEVSDVDVDVERALRSLYTPRADAENLRAMIRRGYRPLDNGRFVRFPRREDEMRGVEANWSIDVTETFKGVTCPLSIALAAAIDETRLLSRRRVVEEIGKAVDVLEHVEFDCGHDVPGFRPGDLGSYIKSWARRIAP